MSTTHELEAAGSSKGLIEQLFDHRDAITRHLLAPRLSERQAYLGKLLATGYRRKSIKERASMLCHIVQGGLLGRQIVTEHDLLDALTEWIGGAVPPARRERMGSGKEFLAAARSWTKFVGTYSPSPRRESRFERELRQFTNWLHGDLGHRETSISSVVSELRSFLIWLTPHCSDLSDVTLAEVDAFVVARRLQGKSCRTIMSDCNAIRLFFRYAEERGWSRENLSKTVRPPSFPVTERPLRCPPWRDIRRTLRSLDTPDPSHVRARAILFLASIYGLRRSEIVRLTLEDFDWKNAILTVQRSKRGRTQQFPLVREVGEAVIRYLRLRPKCSFREVFLTMTLPYRPARNFAPAVRKVLDSQNIFRRSWGMHAFRHACATELLRKGTSLRGIADFLGHRDIQTVSVYAHSDLRALRDVAALNLKKFRCD